MRSTIRTVFSALALIGLLAACSSEGSGLPALEAAKTDDTNYRLGPGDKLHIQVLGAEDLTGDYAVADNGTINSPLIGDVKAAGLTRSQLEREMERKLADGFIKRPHVSVSVLTYRPFYIYGEVSKPGEYPYASGMRVLSAVAAAQGYTYRANQDFVIVTRNGEDNRADVFSSIQPDDIIRVPERYF